MALTGNFDLYHLIVELVFGNLLAAFFGIVVAILIIGIITRLNMLTILYIIILFFASYFTLWYGGLFIGLTSIAVILYTFGGAIYRWFKEWQS